MPGKQPELKWDHSVHYVNDLDETIARFEKLGINAFHGGSHKLWGTHNALSYFGLTYLEFISIEDREVLENPPEPNLISQSALEYLPDHEALSRVALRTDDLDAVREGLEDRGLTLSPVRPGKRTDKNGRLIEWRMFTIGGDYHGLLYPFFIEWKEKDETRLAEFQQQLITEHPAGHVHLTAAVFETEDPQAASSHWAELFGFEKTEHEREVHLRAGDHTFIFQEGNRNAFTEVRLKSEAPELQGKTVTIGEGKYVFQ